MPTLETTCPIKSLNRTEEEQAIAHTIDTMKNQNLLKNNRDEVNLRGKLRNIAKHTDIFSPTEAKNYIGSYKKRNGEPASNGLKISLQESYVHFAEANNLLYTRIKIKYEAPIPLIPTQENVEIIINSAPKEYYTPFKIMQETAIEEQELRNITQKMIDNQQGTISVSGTKQHDNGIYKLSNEVAENLRFYLAEHQEENPFPQARKLGEEWARIKKRRAKELNKPELLKIQLKNLRNYAGAVFYLTMGKDPIATKNFMRHKRLEQTMHYLKGILTFSAKADRISKIVSTPEEAVELINQGFKEEAVFAEGTPQEKHIYSKIKY